MSTPDLSEFEALAPSRRRPCRVCEARAQLGDKDRAALDAACAAPHITGGAIAEWLKRRGHELHFNYVTHHRKKGCLDGE